MAMQAVPNSVAQRIIIKFLTKEGVIPSEIFTRIQAQFGDKFLSQTRMFSWAKSFREGRDRVENEPHARRPRISVNPDNVLKIGELIRSNRRINVLELSQEVGISVGSVEEILHNDLKVKLNWDVLPYPSYSPDLAPSNYYLFGPMKRVLEGMRLRNNDEVTAAVQSWIHKHPKTFFETGIKKLPERWHKYMAVNKDYIEN
jgi:hypothetical protein